MLLEFKLWFYEAIEPDTEKILYKINTTYGQSNKQHLQPTELELFIKSLKDSPENINIAAAKQQLDSRLNIQPKTPKTKNSTTQDEELITNYFLKQNINMELIKDIFKDIQILKNAKQIKLNFQKIPYINQEPFANFNDFSTKIHEYKSSYEFKKNKQNLVTPENKTEGAIATSPDGTISIYVGDSHKKCILHGKGTTFCISSKSSPQWYYTYRFEYGQTQYFIIDKNQKPPADLVNAGVAPPQNYSEWVDRKNSPNKITGFKSVDEYKAYLTEKFGKNIDEILKPIPLSPEELEIKKAVDLIEQGKQIPEEIWNDKEKLLLLFHMGHNLNHQDYLKLMYMENREPYVEAYMLNLNQLKERDCRYLSDHLDLLQKWLNEQDEVDNIEVIRLLLAAKDLGKTLKIIEAFDSQLILGLRADKDVIAHGVINSDNYEKWVELALFMEENYDKSAIHFLYNKTYREPTMPIINKALSWLVDNKKSWEYSDIRDFIDLWDSILEYHERSNYSTRNSLVAKIITGKDFDTEQVYDILYATNADEEIKKALGPNLSKLDNDDDYNWEKLERIIKDKYAP